MEEVGKYKAMALSIECKPQRNAFVCIVKEIHGNDVKLTEISAKEISVDGCGGVDAEIKPSVIRLKGRFFGQFSELEERFRENPEWFKEKNAIDVELDKGTLFAFSVQSYPCE